MNFRERPLHLAIFLFFLGLFSGLSVSFVRTAPDLTFKYLDQFHYVLQTIETEYVDDISVDRLFQGAMRGMLKSLDDPYSRFLDSEDYGDFREEVTGQFTGIGVEITLKGEDVVVISPIEDGPAYKAGIRSGDIILQVNDQALKADNVNEVMKDIRMPSVAKAKLVVKRSGVMEPLEFNIVKAPIKLKSVKYGNLPEAQSTAYLKITHFYNDTALEVEKALKDVASSKRLVIDLRDNPGGSMEAAIRIAELFLPEGKTIVTTRGREGSKILEEYKAGKNGYLYKGDLYVLVNGGSASSSEILSGALKDNGRAHLIGQKTFGKALVQRMIDIDPNKTGFTLTIRKYYTPAGLMIHKKGIEPEIAVAYPEITDNDRKNLARVVNDGLFSGYAAAHPAYSPENVDGFMKVLDDKMLPLSRPIAAYYLKLEIGKGHPSPLYDLEFDRDLSKAIAVINGK